MASGRQLVRVRRRGLGVRGAHAAARSGGAVRIRSASRRPESECTCPALEVGRSWRARRRSSAATTAS